MNAAPARGGTDGAAGDRPDPASPNGAVSAAPASFRWLPYAVAVLSVGAALFVRLALEPAMRGTAPLLLFTLAVTTTAWYGGWRPGVVATLLSLAVAVYFFLDPIRRLLAGNVADVVYLLVFAVVGTAISALCGGLREAKRRATEALQARIEADGRRSVSYQRERAAALETEQARIALDASRKQLLLALDAAVMVAWEWNPATGEVTQAGDPSVIFPRPVRNVDEFVGQIHPDDRYRVVTALQQTLDTGCEYQAEFRIAGAAGGIRWVLDRGRMRQDGDRRVMAGVIADITARKRAEHELAELTQRLETHLETSPLAVVEYTPEFRISRWSKEAERIFGWTAAEVDGKHFSEFRWIYEEDIPGIEKIVAGMFTGAQRTCVSPNRNWTKGGEVRHMEWYNSAITDERGKLVSVLCLGLDVTGRKQAEDRLQESEDRFRQLADSIPQLAWITDASGYIYWYNQRWYEYTGTDFDQMQGWGWEKIHHPDHVDRVRERWRAALAAGEGWEDTFPLRSRNGDWRWFLSRAQPIKDSQGSVVRWFGTNTDVTEQLASQAALRESDERLRVALAAGRMGTWTIDYRTGVATIDEGECALLGLEPCETNLSLERFLTLVHPEDREEVRAAQQVQPGERRLRAEFRIRRADTGEVRWLAAEGAVLPVDEGLGPRTSGVNWDITERKLAEQALARQAHELERSNEDLRSFAYAAAHDLQEPLRTVTSYTQLLARAAADQLHDDHRLYMSYVVAGAHRMRELIRGLQEYLEVSSGDLETSPVDLGAALRQAMTNLQESMLETGAVVRAAPLPAVSGKGIHFLQLWQNLLSNAIKYRRPGAAPEIDISAERQNGFWVVSVRDNGIGIRPEYTDRIFGLFKRLHGYEIPGTGIGLALCQKIVERYGGEIWVESEEGSGSTFKFSLPAGSS